MNKEADRKLSYSPLER